MKKSSYFIIGIILSIMAAAGFWALKEDRKKPEILQKTTKKISLLTINYIATPPSKPLEDGKYLEYSTISDTTPIEKDLKDLKGKPVILHFWATWCGPCVKELPELDRYVEKHQEKAHIIALVTDFKDIEKIRAFYAAQGIKNLPIMVDKKAALAHKLHASSALPTTVFMNSSGVEIGRIQGAIDWSGMAGRLLDAHLSRH